MPGLAGINASASRPTQPLCQHDKRLDLDSIQLSAAVSESLGQSSWAAPRRGCGCADSSLTWRTCEDRYKRISAGQAPQSAVYRQKKQGIRLSAVRPAFISSGIEGTATGISVRRAPALRAASAVRQESPARRWRRQSSTTWRWGRNPASRGRAGTPW